MKDCSPACANEYIAGIGRDEEAIVFMQWFV